MSLPVVRDGTTVTAARTVVTYWTGWLSPEIEGISKEVFALSEHFTGSRILGLSRSYYLRVSRRQRYLGLHARAYPLVRALAAMFERWSVLHHIYGSMADWHFLRALRRRPVVMTLAVSARPLGRDLYTRVRRFVVHATRMRAELTDAGIDPGLIRVVYPGVDLTRFHPNGAEASVGRPFRVLFATSPTHREGLAARGVPILLDAAARLPDVEFHLCWRPWPEAAAVLRHLGPARELPNVRVTLGRVVDMPGLLRGVHATIAPFIQSDDMKVCPTSIVESLACGTPALVSSAVGVADLVDETRAGVVFEPTADGLCEAVEQLRRHHSDHAREARACAERHFDSRQTFRTYKGLYADVLAERHRAFEG